MRCLVVGVVLAISVPAFAEGEPKPAAPTTNPWLRAAAVSTLATVGATVFYVVGVRRIDDLEDQSQAALIAGNEAEVQRINASGERWSTITWITALTTTAGAAATIVFLVKGVRLRNRREAANIRVAPLTNGRVAGLQLGLRW